MLAILISRTEALAKGLPHFFTGKPCRRGHIAERITSNHDCLACLAERSRVRRSEKPDEKKASNGVYYSRNRSAVAKINAAWRDENSQRMKELRDTHYRANKGAYNARARQREAHIKRATPTWVDQASIRLTYKEAACLTLITGIQHEVDHIIPLRGKSVCGLHVPWNLRAIPANENRSKGNEIRHWVCSDCGTTHDRDVNAALNILRVGLERQAPVVEIPVL